MLKTYTFSPQYSIEKDADPEDLATIEDLQKQNAGLKQLIAQMTTEMETLGQEGGKNLNTNSNAVIGILRYLMS